MADEATMADALTRQMAGQWQGLMSVMTKQGASRTDILELSLSVAVVVLTTTADALWGQTPRDRAHDRAAIPSDEEATAWALIDLETTINGLLAELRAKGDSPKEAA